MMEDCQLSFEDSGCVDTSATFYTPTSKTQNIHKKEDSNDLSNFSFSNFSLEESFNHLTSKDFEDHKNSKKLILPNDKFDFNLNMGSIFEPINKLNSKTESPKVDVPYTSNSDYRSPTSHATFELSKSAFNDLMSKQHVFKRPQNSFDQACSFDFSTPKHSTQVPSYGQNITKFFNDQSLKPISPCNSSCYSSSFLTKRFLNDVAVNNNNISLNEECNTNFSNDIIFENKRFQSHQLSDNSFQQFFTPSFKAERLYDSNDSKSYNNRSFDSFKSNKFSQQIRSYQQQKEVPILHQSNEFFSKKVFIGGLPPDIDEEEIACSFRRFGALTVDWPHKAESKSYFPPKGYCFLIFESESSVQKLIESCVPRDDKLFWSVSSPTVKEKNVQVRPWRLKDADFVMDNTIPINPQRTIFVGGVPRPLRAVELALIIERLYGGVSYTGIDLDPDLKYPKGAARVAFHSHESYIAAVNARFVQLQYGDIDKRVEVKPYVLDDQICKHCEVTNQTPRLAPFFCANVTCLDYFCESCWSLFHNNPDGRAFHKPLVREGTDRPKVLPFKW